MVVRDPTASESKLIRQWDDLVRLGQTAAAVELLQANPSLQECQINADKLMALMDSIQAVERFFYDSVLDKICRLGNQKGNWNANMSTTAEGSDRLYKYDVVRYPVDGVYQYFMFYADEVVAGTLPTDTTKYLQMSIKGDKGDRGDDGTNGIDGIDGASGLGMSPRGAWVRTKEYFQYDVVSHNGYLWYALIDNTAVEPVDGSAEWVRFNISTQVTSSTTTPNNLEDGGLWLHMQEDGHIIMKSKNESGEYIPYYPESRAKYILDDTGENLQRKIYRQYFERDDVVVNFKEEVIDGNDTYTAKAMLVSDNTIVVAKSVATDTLAANGTLTTEMTVYDETGVFVVYKVRQTIVEDENGTTVTPTVII